MNWKKFLIEATIVGGLTATAMWLAPAFLVMEAPAVLWGTEIGLGYLGYKGLSKAWEHLWQDAPQAKEVVVKAEVQPQQTAKKNEKTNTQEKEHKRSPRRWMKAPRFVGRWRSKTGGNDKSNYRDAA